MMTPNHNFDHVKYLVGADYYTLVAAAGTDGADVTGEIIDRLGYDELNLVLQTAISDQYSTDDTIVSITIRESVNSDMSTSTTLATLAALTLANAGSGSLQNAVSSWKVPLQGAKRYVRALINVNMAATGTGVANYTATAVLGAPTELPTGTGASASVVTLS
jgi:hypothetical protein